MMQDDDNLWLEEVEGEDALDWVRAQNERSTQELEAHGDFAAMQAEALAIVTSEDRLPQVSLRGAHVYNFWQDENHVRGLWRRMPKAAFLKRSEEWEILLDVDKLAEEEGENWVFGGANVCRDDHDLAILTLSRGGSDAAVRREFRIGKGFVEGGFTLEEAKAGTAWLNPDTLLVSTDFGDETTTESGYPRVVKRWARGTTLDEAETLYQGEKSDVGVFPFADGAGDLLVAGAVRAKTFFEHEYLILRDDGGLAVVEVPERSDLAGVTAGQLILTLNEEWETPDETYPSGSVVAVDYHTGTSELLFAPTDKVAVGDIATAKETLLITLLDNIKGRVVCFSRDEKKGWQHTPIDLPDMGVVSVMAMDEDTGESLIVYEDPTTPQTLFQLEVGGAPLAVRTAPGFFQTGDVVVEQRVATSADGTEVPYFLVAKESTLEGGPAPTVQYGYGGFQVSILPTYLGPTGKLWIERGGVYVIANIRGGGEFGPGWHQAALKTNRQRAYDDFFAVSEALIADGVTTAQKLGVLGGSNGGLLTGVALTQRPDLYGAVGIGVPLLDMLRFDRLLAGASWVGEYGSPQDEGEASFLRSISPFHALKSQETYPRPFFFTSTKDDRVHPGHARRMAKRMEEMGHPFLYFENIEGGHGAAANQRQLAYRLALQYAYFASELGLDPSGEPGQGGE